MLTSLVFNIRLSATISPSSDHSLQSPSTDVLSTGNHLYNGKQDKQFIQHQDQDDGIQIPQESNLGGGYQQYSSQDSLPDSPYSSQSLDSQSTQGAGIKIY